MSHFVSEGIDINRISASKKCDICHYWHFLDKIFKFQTNAYNGYHNVLMMSMNLSDIAVLNLNGADYRCVINRFSKCEAIYLLEKADLTEKCGTL